MNSDERDDLWELLGKAKAPAVSPYFSRNVLRAIREEEAAPQGWLARLVAHWRTVAVAAAAVVVIAGGAFFYPQPQPDPLVALARQVSVSPDYQVITHLDELLDSEQNSIWLEASAY